MHPIMSSKYWINVGVYFADHDFQASADGTVAGKNNEFDFERAFDLDAGPDLFTAEFGWQVTDNWGLAMQYFRSERNGSRALAESIEWEDVTYEVGVDLAAGTELSIFRTVVSRRFWDGGPHSARLSAGIHWLELGAQLSGEATLDDMSTEFRNESVSASAPVPNIGARYSYSPSNRWLISARVDWLSADIDEYSGSIWNASAGFNLRISEHLGGGVAYQFFEIDGKIKNDSWYGNISTRFSGPQLYFSAYW